MSGRAGIISAYHPEEEIDLNADEANAIKKRDVLRMLNADLEASTVTVADINPKAVKDLEGLETSIDNAIVSNAIASAGLDFINGVIADAVKVGDIVKGQS